MSVGYKLVKKQNPNNRAEAGKWYAVPKSGSAASEKMMTRLATEETTVADVELLAAAKLIGKVIHNQVVQGHRVKIPRLGSFRLSFGSDGVEEISEFNPSMIRNPKIVFTIDSDLRKDILGNLTYEIACVEDEGVQYASVAKYKEAKGLTTATGGTGTTGGEDSGSGTGEGGGQEVNPLS